jgi:DNA-binding Xre family transcriptional regulator
MNTIWKLKEFMKAHRIKPGELARSTHGQLSRAGVYGLLRNERPQSVHFETLDALLPALRELTGKGVEVGDLIVYGELPQTESQRNAWRKLIGTLNDPDSPGDVSRRHDDYIDAAINAEHLESVAGKR